MRAIDLQMPVRRQDEVLCAERSQTVLRIELEAVASALNHEQIQLAKTAIAWIGGEIRQNKTITNRRQPVRRTSRRLLYGRPDSSGQQGLSGSAPACQMSVGVRPSRLVGCRAG